MIFEYICRMYICLPNEWPQDGSIFDHSRFKCDSHDSSQWSGSGQIAIFETAGPHVHLEYIIACSSMFFHSSSNATDENYLFGENAITKWGGTLRVSQVLNMDSLLVMKLPWAASKFKGNFLLLYWLCSSTNFVCSNHVGVMLWAHNISAAAPSHQVSDLRMWSCENVTTQLEAQGVYPPATYVDVFQLLILSYFILPPWH